MQLCDFIIAEPILSNPSISLPTYKSHHEFSFEIGEQRKGVKYLDLVNMFLSPEDGEDDTIDQEGYNLIREDLIQYLIGV